MRISNTLSRWRCSTSSKTSSVTLWHMRMESRNHCRLWCTESKWIKSCCSSTNTALGWLLRRWPTLFSLSYANPPRPSNAKPLLLKNLRSSSLIKSSGSRTTWGVKTRKERSLRKTSIEWRTVWRCSPLSEASVHKTWTCLNKRCGKCETTHSSRTRRSKIWRTRSEPGCPSATI